MTGGSARKLRFIQEIRNQLDIWTVSEDSKSSSSVLTLISRSEETLGGSPLSIVSEATE